MPPALAFARADPGGSCDFAGVAGAVFGGWKGLDRPNPEPDRPCFFQDLEGAIESAEGSMPRPKVVMLLYLILAWRRRRLT